MGTTEIIIIAIVLVILFGGKKVTEWSKGLGEATKEVSKLKKDLIEDTDPNKDDSPDNEALADNKEDVEVKESDEEGEVEEAEVKEDFEPEKESSDTKAVAEKDKPKKTAKKSKKKGVDPLPEGDEDNVWSKFN